MSIYEFGYHFSLLGFHETTGTDAYSQLFLGAVYGNAFSQVTRKFVQHVVYLSPPCLNGYLPVLSVSSWFSFVAE